MANDAYKKIVEQNEKTIANLKRAMFLLMVLHSAMHIIRVKSIHFSRVVVSLATIAVIVYCFNFLQRAARPARNKDGELRGNRSVTEGVLYNTFFDIIYLFSFCLFLYSFSDKMAWAFLCIPAFAVITLWFKIVKPWLFKTRFTDEAYQQKDAEMLKLYEKYQEKQYKGKRKYKY